MSPLVRLLCYPTEDGEFTAGVTLHLDVPDSTPIVEDVLAKLRARYPSVAIHLEPRADETVAWHVYRDGLPI